MRGHPGRGCHHQHLPHPWGVAGLWDPFPIPEGCAGAKEDAFLLPMGAKAAWPGSSAQLLPGVYLGPLAPLQSQIIFSPFCQIYCRKMGSDFFLILGWGEKYAAGRAEGKRFPRAAGPRPPSPWRCRRCRSRAGAEHLPRGLANFSAPQMGSVKPPPEPSQMDDSKYFINHHSAVISLIGSIDGNVNGPY